MFEMAPNAAPDSTRTQGRSVIAARVLACSFIFHAYLSRRSLDMGIFVRKCRFCTDHTHGARFAGAFRGALLCSLIILVTRLVHSIGETMQCGVTLAYTDKLRSNAKYHSRNTNSGVVVVKWTG